MLLLILDLFFNICLMFDFLFCMFVFYYVYSVFLCIVSTFVLSCLIPIFAQVYLPLPPGGDPTEVNKYHIIHSPAISSVPNFI